MHTPSQGDAYVEKVKPEECRPEKTTFLWQDALCFEVDAESGGKAFGVRIKTPHPCAPEGSLNSFDEKKRECWLVDPSGGVKFRAKVDVRECRPPEDQLIKKFFLDSSGAGSECLEIHRSEGNARWEKKLNPTECRPAETRFLWRMTGELKGDCYEVALEGPQLYCNKVGAQRCRPASVSYLFDRTAEKRGDCYEVDVETKGQNWAQKVAPSFCRVKED